jgi:phosphate-selective porin OprO/OprP
VNQLSFFLLLLVNCVILVALPTAFADETTSKTVELSPSDSTRNLGERLEHLGRLYKNEDDNILQELWVLGRYHGQYYWSEGSLGQDNGYETRRFRFGSHARLFKNLTLHAQVVSGSDLDPFFNGFTELWAQWSFSPEVALTIGQQKNRFTHDRNASSRYINYLERGMLTNMFGVDYTPAVTLQGTIQKTSYYAGVFSNATGSDMVEAFTELNSGYSLLAATYYDLGEALGADRAYLYGSYVYSDANQNATNLNRFNNGVSSALILTRHSASLVTEATAGLGSENGNAFGINLQPGYFLTNSLQLATRYQLAISNDEEGLSPQRRYEANAKLPKGDLYQAAYIGLNYYLAKHRIKLMSGIEYSHMQGEQVWTASTMFRVYFGPHSGGAFPMNQMLPGNFFEYD